MDPNRPALILAQWHQGPESDTLGRMIWLLWPVQAEAVRSLSSCPGEEELATNTSGRVLALSGSGTVFRAFPCLEPGLRPNCLLSSCLQASLFRTNVTLEPSSDSFKSYNPASNGPGLDRRAPEASPLTGSSAYLLVRLPTRRQPQSQERRHHQCFRSGNSPV